MATAAFVVPCFNEERRLDVGRFASLARDPRVDLLFVDDGSTDGTGEVLRALSATVEGKVLVHALPKNAGKGEAVRQGLLAALGRGYELVGFADADLATPPDELRRLVELMLASSELEVCIASRVLMVGRQIERDAKRHYLGRIFATVAANVLRTPFYDTQCGAKVFRSTRALREALARPFVSRWAFDVELLGRLLIGTAQVPGVAVESMREEPLRVWIDQSGSKLRFKDMARTVVDLARIEVDLDRRRRERAERA